MKLFLDTANLKDIDIALSKGFIQGITTNPSLMSKEPKGNYIEHMKKIVNLIQRDDRRINLSVEVFATTKDEMIKQAEDIVSALNYKDLSIKIPIGWEELEVIHTLSQKNISINCTCIFSEAQCMLATNAGARYISIFGNRVKDLRGSFVTPTKNIREWLDLNRWYRSDTDTEIIVGSIRSALDIVEAQLAGAHIVTAGLQHYKAASEHAGTTESVNAFLDDFKEWMS